MDVNRLYQYDIPRSSRVASTMDVNTGAAIHFFDNMYGAEILAEGRRKFLDKACFERVNLV